MKELGKLMVFFVTFVVFGMLTQVWANGEKPAEENPIYNLVGNYEKAAYPLFKKS